MIICHHTLLLKVTEHVQQPAEASFSPEVSKLRLMWFNEFEPSQVGKMCPKDTREASHHNFI